MSPGALLEPAVKPVQQGLVVGDKWRIDERLGQGGMSVVMLATDLSLGRQVAIKFLAAHLVADEGWRKRFWKEAQTTARLDHPHLVPIYEVGEYEGRPYLVMKYLQGQPFSDVLSHGPLSIDATVAVLRPVAKALDYLHGLALLHRDVKPANVWVGADGHVTLLDLGILRDLREDAATSEGIVLGTLAYMPPEQLTRSTALDRRGDVYSLAAVAYQALTGVAPFSGEDAAVAHAKLSNALSNPRALNSALNEATSAVLLAAMDVRPERRPSTASAFVDQLEKPPEVPAPVLARPTKKSTSEGPPTAPLRAQQRLPRTVIATLVGAVVVSVVAAVAIASRTPPTANVPTTLLPATDPRPAPSVEPHVPTPPPPATEPPAPSVDVVPTEAPRSPPIRNRAPVRDAPRTASPVKKGTGELRVVPLVNGAASFSWIAVDGTPRGEAPLTISLPSGRHLVTLTREGFAPVKREVVLHRDEVRTLTVELERR